MKFIIFLILFLLGLVNGPGDKEPGENAKKYQKGMIINMNTSKQDSCGWMIEIEGEKFKPKNLSKAFQKDSLVVKVDYEKSLTDFKCGGFSEEVPEIYVNWMESAR